MRVHWINLTNGLQAIRDYGLTDYRFMRLQSTYCEQKRWDDVLCCVPDDFYLRVAVGDECVVYDYGANKPVPRAVWQGLELVKFVLHLRWLGKPYQLQGRASMGYNYFNLVASQINKRTKKRIDYFKPLVKGEIKIQSITGPTIHDGDKLFMFQCLSGIRND